MENNEAVETVDNRLSIVRDLASDIRKMILVMIASDNDQDIVKYAKGINQNLNNIEQEYFKAIRELAIEQTISTSLVQVLSGSEEKHEEAQPDHDENESIQQVIEFPPEERGETKAVENVDELPYVEENKGTVETEKYQDEEVDKVLDKIVKVGEPSFKERAKQTLLKDTVYNTGGQRYYLVSGIPSEEYGSNTVSYIEGFDTDTLEYLLIEVTSDFNRNVTSDVIIRIDDEDELRRHVEGKPFTFKYLTPDGHFTDYAKKLIVRQMVKGTGE